MGALGVVWGAVGSLVSLSHNFPYSEAPLERSVAPGAFLKSRKCLKIRHNWSKSLKNAQASIWSAPFTLVRASMCYIAFLWSLWLRRLSTTSLNLCKSIVSLRRLFKLGFSRKSFQNVYFRVKITNFRYESKAKAPFACEFFHAAPRRPWCFSNLGDKAEAPQWLRNPLRGARRLLKVKILVSDDRKNGKNSEIW